MSNDDPRLNRPPGNWLSPGGRTPPTTWGLAPATQQMWAGPPKRNWFARHKVLTGIGGGLLGLSLMVGVVAATTRGPASTEASESPAAVTTAAPIVNVKTPEDEAAVVAKKAAADKTAAKKAATTKKAAAEKVAADKAAAKKAAAEKKAARKAAKQRATLPEGTGCKLLGEEAVRISSESKLKVKVTRVSGLKIMKDNRKTFAFPTGVEHELVLACRGLAATSDGMDNVPVAVRMEVDSGGKYYVGYRGI